MFDDRLCLFLVSHKLLLQKMSLSLRYWYVNGQIDGWTVILIVLEEISL